jgi:hypothetical protein
MARDLETVKIKPLAAPYGDPTTPSGHSGRRFIPLPPRVVDRGAGFRYGTEAVLTLRFPYCVPHSAVHQDGLNTAG